MRRLLTTRRRPSFVPATARPALLLSALLACVPAQASEADEDIFSSFGDENFVSIATGKRQALQRAPAVASVITAEDIRAMGAKDLNEMLETVPGLHVGVNATGYNPMYIIRGIRSKLSPEFNAQVLMLVNGIPITNVFAGDRGQVWGGFPLESVQRVEVIRGPGSAIYGADAFAGTINIITKSAERAHGLDSGISYGSYDERRAWATAQHLFGSGFELFTSIEYRKTDGVDETIEADAQTTADTLFPPAASLAPGKTELRGESVDARLEVKKDLVKLRMSYAERINFGTGAGANQALDPEGEANAIRFSSDLTYRDPNFSEHWDVQAQLSYFDSQTKNDLVLAPPGANLPFNFPDGLIGNPNYSEKHWRTEFSGFFSGFDNHELRIGVGYQYLDQYRIEESKNFVIQLSPGPNPVAIPFPLGGVVDVTDTTPFNQEETRKIYYAFVQDEWAIAPDWSVTAGLRYDHYSDFGETINPRFALVWQTSYKLTTKLLYGRAFRAPSFVELFNINNPIALGNPNLDPEVIDTTEIAFNYAASTQLHFGLNLFYYEMQDIIRFEQNIAENTDDQTGHGLEFEASYSPFDNWRLTGNYAWQSSDDEQTDDEAPNVPRQQFYLRSDWEFISGMFANLQINHVMDRERAQGDSRSAVDDYTKVDLYLRATELLPSWEFAAGVKNLTDEDIYEPSLGTDPVPIPGDLPLGGRSYFAEIRKTF